MYLKLFLEISKITRELIPLPFRTLFRKFLQKCVNDLVIKGRRYLFLNFKYLAKSLWKFPNDLLFTRKFLAALWKFWDPLVIQNFWNSTKFFSSYRFLGKCHRRWEIGRITTQTQFASKLKPVEMSYHNWLYADTATHLIAQFALLSVMHILLSTDVHASFCTKDEDNQEMSSELGLTMRMI